MIITSILLFIELLLYLKVWLQGISEKPQGKMHL